MFRSTTIIMELVLNLGKVIFMLKHSIKLHLYMLFGDVAACHRAACVLCALHGLFVIVLCRIFCLPLWYPKIQ
jgi:ABC-type Mn2+/Zn2+ transport system permease subunit